MSIKPLSAVLLIALLFASCAVVPLAVAAGIGVWAAEESSDDSGSIVLAATPDEVYAAAEEVARSRGSELEAVPGSWRVSCEVESASVTFTVFPVAGDEHVAELKVRARELIQGRADLAEDLAMDVKNRLSLQG